MGNWYETHKRCACGCHHPTYGMQVKHMAPCCDRSGMMYTEEESDASR